MTMQPQALASCTAASPTPPLAPWMRHVSPAWARAERKSACDGRRLGVRPEKAANESIEESKNTRCAVAYATPSAAPAS